MIEISQTAFRLLAGLLENRTGQRLADNRRWRIDTALRPIMNSRGFASIDALVTAIISGRDAGLQDDVIDGLLNNETYFFRDLPAFDALGRLMADEIGADRNRERRLRVWCAGCSTGQEAYSVAMMLADQSARWAGWTIDLVATDISRTAISRAREGMYNQFEIQRGLPVRQMMRWFVQQGESWVIRPELAKMVRFQRLSLAERPPLPCRFDVILCRNVLLYFSPEMRRRVLDTLADSLLPEGVLMLGAGETVLGQSDRFASTAASRGLYRLVDPVPGIGRHAA